MLTSGPGIAGAALHSALAEAALAVLTHAVTVLVGGRRCDRGEGAGDEGEQSRNENEALHLVFSLSHPPRGQVLTNSGFHHGRPAAGTATRKAASDRHERRPPSRW